MKNIFLRVSIFLFFVVVLAGSVSDLTLDAMSWPSADAALVRNFGANDRGSPIMGMVFAGGTEVLAAEKGEVIFSRAKNDPASRLPSPLGAWTALDHGDGLISIYSRYAELTSAELSSAELDVNEIVKEIYVEKQQPIALSGTSGWSSRDGFYFMLFDRRERRWINPAMIITPAAETRPPQIISVDLYNAQGILMQSRNLVQGRYTVVVNAAGGARLSGGAPSLQYAPQRIVCLVNGAEVGALNFEAVSARDGVKMVFRNGLVPAKQIYNHFPAYEAAEVFLTRGQVTLEVIVQDITGASRSVVNRLIVN